MQTPKCDLVISDCAILPMNNSDLIMDGIIAVKLKMAKTKGATALGNEREVGQLEAGKRADIVLIDLSKPHLKPLHNVCANLSIQHEEAMWTHVIVDGKVLMENRHVKTLNERTVMEKAEETALDLASR